MKIEKSGLVITLADGTVLTITPPRKGSADASRVVIVPSRTAAEALYHKGKYAEAAKAFEGIVAESAGTPEALRALMMAILCDEALLYADSIQKRMRQMELMLLKLPREDRASYERWMKTVRIPAK